MKKPLVRPRNAAARALRDPRCGQRVVANKKAYSRKGKNFRHQNQYDGGHYLARDSF